MSYKNNSSKQFNKNFTLGQSFELLSDVQLRRCVFQGTLMCEHTLVSSGQHGAIDIDIPHGCGRECVSLINML